MARGRLWRLGSGLACFLNERAIHRTRRGILDGTEDRAVGAFLDVEPRRRSVARGECVNLAAGVPHYGGCRVWAAISWPPRQASNRLSPKGTAVMKTT
jgi:hypothetical protein